MIINIIKPNLAIIILLTIYSLNNQAIGQQFFQNPQTFQPQAFLPADIELPKNMNEPISLRSSDPDFCVIVRYPVHANKLNHLKQQLNNPNISEKSKKSFEKLYTNTINENSDNFNLLFQTFETHFKYTEFYFLPDSSFKAFSAHPNGLFVNQNEAIDPQLTCSKSHYYLIINGKDEDQFLFVTPDLVRAPDPLPYKKSIFLPAFKKIFNRPGYLATQVKYFNDELFKYNAR
ncbi:MAG: hypothetical protein LC107_12110 [Chitinophagales bacterium]|nr:hypothetical protein [Chitinophagales bacterium]